MINKYCSRIYMNALSRTRNSVVWRVHTAIPDGAAQADVLVEFSCERKG